MKAAAHILIIEDHPLVADAIGRCTQGLAPDAQIQRVMSLAHAVRALQSGTRFDLLLADLTLPDAEPDETLAQLRKTRPEGLLVALTATEEQEALALCALHDARFISKSSMSDVLTMKLAQALNEAGIATGTPGAHAVRERSGDAEDVAASWAADSHDIEGLTARQREVLAEVALGLSNKQVARKLGMSDATVTAHLKEIYRRTDTLNRTQAGQLYLKWSYTHNAH